MVEKGRFVKKNHGNIWQLWVFKSKGPIPSGNQVWQWEGPKKYEGLNLRIAFKFGELFVACLITGG